MIQAWLYEISKPRGPGGNNFKHIAGIKINKAYDVVILTVNNVALDKNKNFWFIVS